MAGGALSSDRAPAFAAVPRSAFLPELIWPYDMDAGGSVAVSLREDRVAGGPGWQVVRVADVE